jgi:hypothetical protein
VVVTSSFGNLRELQNKPAPTSPCRPLVPSANTLTGGKLRYLMAALATHSHAALVVECRYSEVFKLDRIRPAVVADALAEAQIRFPSVPIIFAETRQLAQEWTYRFFGAALQNHAEAG